MLLEDKNHGRKFTEAFAHLDGKRPTSPHFWRPAVASAMSGTVANLWSDEIAD